MIPLGPRASGPLAKTLREAALFCAYVLLAIAATWPLAERLNTATSDLGDPLLNAWIIDWDCHALLSAPLHIYDAPIFFPSRYPLAYSENLIGIAIVVLPFHLAGVAPLALHNIALILGFAISAYAGYLLALVVTRATIPSVIAGLLYGFVPYKLGHLAHVQIIWSAGPALLLAALLLYRRTPSKPRAALVALAFAASAIVNLYLFLFGAVAGALTLVLIAIAERRDRRFWTTLFAALAIAGVALIPILMPYVVVSREYDMRRGDGETLGASALPADWLTPSSNSAPYGKLVPDSWHHNERELFPGLLFVLLPIAAFAMTPRRGLPSLPIPRRRWLDALIVLLLITTIVALAFHTSTIPMTLLIIAVIARLPLRDAMARSRFPIDLWIAALWIVIGVIGSLGMHAFFHSLLFHDVPGFRATRAPARWALIAYAGLCVWAAVGAMAVMKRRRVVAALLTVLAVVDVWPCIRWEQALTDPLPVDRWLARTHAGPLIELPLRNDLEYEYLLRATTHRVPLFDGISGFEPPLHRRLRTEPLGDTAFDLLEQNGCRYVLIHIDAFSPLPGIAFDWIRRGLDEGRLVFLQRFDHDLNGDWLFALRRARVAPSEQLLRLLDSKPTYNTSTFGRVDRPRYSATIEGALDVSGWALSPDGIRNIDILIDSGRLRVPASLTPNPEISRAQPWYPKTTRPSFSARIDHRPRGVPEKTDVQVEVVDGAGRVTRMADALITWRD